MEGRVLTCVYCGHEYPQDTPSWGNNVLTEHIKVCPKHPMRQAEATIAALREENANLRNRFQQLAGGFELQGDHKSAERVRAAL
jgi:hypothetical protein